MNEDVESPGVNDISNPPYPYNNVGAGTSVRGHQLRTGLSEGVDLSVYTMKYGTLVPSLDVASY